MVRAKAIKCWGVMLNQSRIDELKAEVGEDDFAEVVELFCEEMDEVFDDIAHANPTKLRECLHFLKGSALNVGLETVGNLCINAENTLASNEEAAVDLDELRSIYEQSKLALAKA